MRLENKIILKNEKMEGLIHTYTGEGKGKTTAAMGAAARALGHGFNVKIVQFFKEATGEKKVFSDLCSYSQFNHPHPLFQKDQELARENQRLAFTDFWQKEVDDILKEKYDLVVLDELGALFDGEIVDNRTIKDFIEKKPRQTELIMTGRNIPSDIIALSQYCTEMREIKHPFRKGKGVLARKGIEF